MSEAQRLQNVEMSEAKRMQVAETSGRDYEFKVRESREGVQLDRKQAEIDSYRGQVAANQQARDGAIGSAIGGLGAVATAAGKLGAKNAAPVAPDRVVNIPAPEEEIYDLVKPQSYGTELV
jgi:hypothetical protein